MKVRKNISIYPLLYFNADWPETMHKLDFDLSLVKAKEEVLKAICSIEDSPFGTSLQLIDDVHDNTQWFLLIPSPEPTEHISIKKSVILFENQLETAIIESFLACLRLTRQTAAICPLRVQASLEDGHIMLDSVQESDHYCIIINRPPVFNPDTFQIGDLQLLNLLWSSIITLRNLSGWANKIYKEEFFANLDNIAVEDARRELLNLLCPSLSKDNAEI